MIASTTLDAAATAAAAAAAAVSSQVPAVTPPMPPFSSDDPWAGAGEGIVKCFFPGCTKQYSDYMGLMNHIKHPKYGHGYKRSDFKGTFFHEQYCAHHTKQVTTVRIDYKKRKVGWIHDVTRQGFRVVSNEK
jgi:hypothetical protein